MGVDDRIVVVVNEDLYTSKDAILWALTNVRDHREALVLVHAVTDLDLRTANARPKRRAAGHGGLARFAHVLGCVTVSSLGELRCALVVVVVVVVVVVATDARCPALVDWEAEGDEEDDAARRQRAFSNHLVATVAPFMDKLKAFAEQFQVYVETRAVMAPEEGPGVLEELIRQGAHALVLGRSATRTGRALGTTARFLIKHRPQTCSLYVIERGCPLYQEQGLPWPISPDIDGLSRTASLSPPGSELSTPYASGRNSLSSSCSSTTRNWRHCPPGGEATATGHPATEQVLVAASSLLSSTAAMAAAKVGPAGLEGSGGSSEEESEDAAEGPRAELWFTMRTSISNDRDRRSLTLDRTSAVTGAAHGGSHGDRHSPTAMDRAYTMAKIAEFYQ
eukprot:SM000047S16874  [mRNA]  locus=s47:447260:449194:- [translate_table: standard]